MPASWTPDTVNQVQAPLPITTAEDTVTIKYTPLNVGSKPPDRPECTLQLRSDQDWHYMHATGGSVYPVKANEVFNLRVLNAFTGLTVYVKAATTSGTLWAMRVQ